MNTEIQRPRWLKVRLTVGEKSRAVREIVQKNKLHTVCQEAHCPNLSDCWQRGTATLMILGDVCTRSCGFCAVKTGKPPVYDTEEPARVAQAVQKMGLRHVVITSVNRDELPDGGAAIWAETIRQVRRANPDCTIEVLTPDFKGDVAALNTVFQARPDIFAHNLETVPALYRQVRPQAKYKQSLAVLKLSHEFGRVTKTGIMVGLGESLNQVLAVMADAVATGVDIFTIGQYLQPTKAHLPVARYVDPQEFRDYRRQGLKLGLKHVESGPLVRSSYHAEQALETVQKT